MKKRPLLVVVADVKEVGKVNLSNVPIIEDIAGRARAPRIVDAI